jgi:hypothetical protein
MWQPDRSVVKHSSCIDLKAWSSSVFDCTKQEKIAAALGLKFVLKQEPRACADGSNSGGELQNLITA